MQDGSEGPCKGAVIHTRSRSQPSRHKRINRSTAFAWLEDSDDDAAGATEGAIAAMRVDLAQKAAEIECLQAAVAEANAVKDQVAALPEMLGDAAAVKSELCVVRQELSELCSSASRCRSTPKVNHPGVC